MQQREFVRCPLCNMEPMEFGVDYLGFHLARCPRCELEFQNPRAVFSELAEKVYNAHYHDEADLAVPETDLHAQHARELRRLEAIAGGKGSVLDVGCGTGAFLTDAIAGGWRAAGTDITMDPHARDSGAELFTGRLSEVDFGRRTFDAVRFHHVLEHTQNPLEELQRARALVRAGGALYVSVPNLAGLSMRLKSLQSRWKLKSRLYRHYSCVHHLWFFTPRTLSRLAEAAGFETVVWETPVRGRSQRFPWLTAFHRFVLEPLRTGSILDFYGRTRTT